MQHWGIDEYENLEYQDKVLLKVGSPMCMPCKELEKKLEMHESNYSFAFASIDTEEIASELVKLGVTELPTTFLFINGVQRGHFEGCPSDEKLYDILDLWDVLE